jgi:nitrite reductase/ring-hydroxylating ferredoxin subunit
MKTKLFFLILLFFSISYLSCKKGNENTVKGGYVDADIYLSDPSSSQLNSIGGWIYYPGGLKGLIIYRRSNELFAAYDRTCTYDPNATCALLKVESSGIIAVDSCCGSRFNIYDGSIVKGPASQAMIQYRTTFDGDIIHVYN